ncbi:MAG: bifunctional UDP-N-acetylmuramoyl-tripeptide:D-alanyl-D-alanine ligase/alanine racemase [Flavobacteriales bacterium]|jgi:alanine racemase|nr:bifunctional UDP-N-acetylmuramoyl-tripeptide:D-alanyl-D-alanine ligase/alanine racemase [Flavobacteriales bacterium]
MQLNAKELLAISQDSESKIFDYNQSIHQVIIDSRITVSNPQEVLFVALKGTQFDGHDFVKALIKKGFYNFLVEYIPTDLEDESVNFFVCEDSLSTLQDIAKKYRKKLRFPILGITGSNGKTVVKEFIYHLLCKEYHISRSPKSFNSQIGVPLSVLEAEEGSDYGVFEAGISEINEMRKLQEIILPEVGIFTNLGDAHQKNFESFSHKFSEKLQLFRDSKTLIIHEDLANQFYQEIKNALPNIKLLKWGETSTSEIRILEIIRKNNFTEITVQIKAEKYTFKIPFHGKIWEENALHTFAFLWCIKMLHPEVLKRFETLPSMSMRLEKTKGLYQSILINDAYSNDTQSLYRALETMKEGGGEKWLILSDFVDVFKDKKTFFTQLSKDLLQYPNYRIIGIGNDWQSFGYLFQNLIETHENAQNFLKSFDKTRLNNKRILIKGARRFAFEKIVEHFSQRPHSTILNVNLDYLKHNFQYFQTQIPQDTEIILMLKAFSYGVGAVELALELEKQAIWGFAVAYVNEGIELRNAGVKAKIMVLNHQDSSIDLMIKHHLEPEIFQSSMLVSWQNTLSSKKIDSYPVHIKLDTGMNRLGFKLGDDLFAIETIQECPNIQLASIFSHLADSFSEDGKSFTCQQINQFKERAQLFEKKLNQQIPQHILNTNGILNYPQASFDMVRLGIGLFGLSVAEKHQKNLLTVLSLTTFISQIKCLEKGEAVGYNRKFIAQKQTKIATIGMGYADGIPRKLGNGVWGVFIRGIFCPFVGDICMDMSMIDISHLKEISENDEVVLWDERFPILEEFAKKADSISYEILCGLSERIMRIYQRD